MTDITAEQDIAETDVTDERATRWTLFSDVELRGLWDALTTDDGIRHSLYPDDDEFEMTVGIRDEAKRRGIDLDGAWAVDSPAPFPPRQEPVTEPVPYAE